MSRFIVAAFLVPALLVPGLSVSAGEAAAEDAPLKPAGVLPAFTEGRVSYVGAFTPDGRHFVYPLLHAEGQAESELKAFDVAAGEARSLGKVPIDPAKIKEKPGFQEGGGSGTPFVGVHAASNDLETVFLEQSLLMKADDAVQVWRTGKKSLVPLGHDLFDERYVGGSPDGRVMAFRIGRHPIEFWAFDGAGGKTVRLDTDSDFSYTSWFSWAGGTLFVFGKTPRKGWKGPEGRRAYRVWPDVKELGVIPSITKTLRTGPGAVKPVACAPLFCGSPGSGDGTLVFFRGGEVVAAKPEALDKPEVLLEIPVDEEPEAWKLPVGVDASENVAYAAWLQVQMVAELDVMSYLPAKDALGADRVVTLKLASVVPAKGKKQAPPLSFDLTALFGAMRAKALRDYEEDTGPKSDSGVLTRQPWVRVYGGRDGKVFCSLHLRVWYGIRGADYSQLFLVDTQGKSLRHAETLVTRWGSGEWSPPPSFTLSVSPARNAVAMIWNKKLYLYKG